MSVASLDIVSQLFEDIARRHPRSLRGVQEARQVAPERFDQIACRFLRWLITARGEGGVAKAVDAFVQFSMDVNLAQARYEASGAYQHKSFAEVYADHYSQHEAMDGYLWGIYLTNFLWAHHAEISLFFEDRFLQRLPAACRFVEIAPGHGGWGTWALHALGSATLEGYDISPTAIAISRSVAAAAGTALRATYTERDALDLGGLAANSADAVICSFLVEHLERPEKLFEVIGHLLRDGGTAFLTGALTAAQIDHIFEFRRESELLLLAESHGLRAIETLSANPRRVLKNARYVPRSMALILRKRTTEFA